MDDSLQMNNLLCMKMDIEMERGLLESRLKRLVIDGLSFRTVFLFDRVLLICKVKVMRKRFEKVCLINGDLFVMLRGQKSIHFVLRYSFKDVRSKN